MDFGGAYAATDEEASMAAPKDQAPLDWTEKLDWRVPRTASVRRAFRAILRDPDYQRTDAWQDAKFQTVLRAHKKLRAEKTKAYARKHAKRRTHSSQYARTNQKRVVVASIRRYWDPVHIEGSQYVLRLPDPHTGVLPAETSEDEDDEGNTPLDLVRHVFDACPDAVVVCEPEDAEEDVEDTDTDDEPSPPPPPKAPLMQWRLPLGVMQSLLEASPLSSPRLLRHLRIRSCAWDLLLHKQVASPRRGLGKGSKQKPVDIDQKTGRIHNGVLLLRVQELCDFGQEEEVEGDGGGRVRRCALCRQRRLHDPPAVPVYQPKMWVQRDKRGDNYEARIKLQHEILEANKDVPCPRGCSSNPILSPITKRTRSIYWTGKTMKNTAKHKAQQRKQRARRAKLRASGKRVPSLYPPHHPEYKRRQRRREAWEKARARKKTIEVPPIPEKPPPPRVTPIDYVMELVGQVEDPLSRAPTPLCVPEGPLRARIRGTRTHMGSREAGEVGRQLINLVTGTVLRMENRGRKTGTLLL